MSKRLILTFWTFLIFNLFLFKRRWAYGVLLWEIESGCEICFHLVKHRIQKNTLCVNVLYKLKKTHSYYYQVMGQMMLTGCQWVDFYVYCKFWLSLWKIEVRRRVLFRNKDEIRSVLILNTSSQSCCRYT